MYRLPQPPLLREAIIGYHAADEDPSQTGNVAPKQSREITEFERVDPTMTPIAQSQREQYVWVARANKDDGINKAMYTMDPESMQQIRNYKNRDQNTCDICGARATEVLFEFRCYMRPKGGDLALTSQ